MTTIQRGIDVSNFSGAPTADAVAALVHGAQLKRAAIACQFPATYAAWYAALRPYDVELWAYRFLYYDRPYVDQVNEALGVIAGTDCAGLWLDCEEDTEHPALAVPADAAAQLGACLDRCGGYPAGIYTREDYWLNVMGNPQLGRRAPLWAAKWGSSPNLDATLDVWFGGWSRAAGVQYQGSFESYGLNVGLDVWGC